MPEASISVAEEFRELLRILSAMSPAYNKITQMFFIMPQRAITLIRLYPEIMEKEDMMREIMGVEYTSEGVIRPKGMGLHLHALYRELFKQLLHPDKRRKLLALANLTEEEFREIDPLRAWIKIALDFLAEFYKDSLKLLDVIIAKLIGKEPNEYVRWSEIIEAASDVEDPERAREILRCFFLLPHEYPDWIYAYECPLLLDIYSDLRKKLHELLKEGAE